MKLILKFAIAASVFPLVSIAQKTMSAESIRATINRNTAVALADVTITGDLDLTKLDNVKPESPRDKEEAGKTYVSTVTSPVSFTNCTFTGNVLGHFNSANGILN